MKNEQMDNVEPENKAHIALAPQLLSSGELTSSAEASRAEKQGVEPDDLDDRDNADDLVRERLDDEGETGADDEYVDHWDSGE